MPTEDISMTLNVLPGTFAGLTAAAAGMNQIVGLVNTLGNRVGQTTTILDSMLVTLSAGITYAGYQAAQSAGEFERAMKMVKVVSGQSAAEIDVLSNKANELSVKFKMGIEDITDGLQTLGRAGLGSLDTQISVLETGLSAAKLSGLELSKVLQDIVQTTSLLGGDITSVSFGSQADALTNKILATSMTAPINMNDIVQTLSYSGGTAAAAGINIENEDALYDYLGTVSAFARKGVSGSMAGTALRAFFTKPASQDESVKGAFETLGLQAEDLWKNNGQQMRKVSEQIQIIHDAMSKKHMSTLDQIELWGKIVGNKMGQQMMKLDESNIREVTQEIQESENATKLAHESMQNFASDLATLQQQGAAMWREFGNAALTVFRPIVSGLKVIAGLLNPGSTSGTIFGQLLAGGIIVVISQVIARLGTAWRLIRNIASELRRQINDHSQTAKQIDMQRAKQMEVYKAMGLSDKQAERLAKDANNTGFNIQFMNKAMTEFLAKLNEVVAMMSQLVAQTEVLARAPLQSAVAGQYTRFYTALNSNKPLKVTGATVPLPAWLDRDGKDIQAKGGLFGVPGTTPYHSDMSTLADTHKLPQEFLTQLYRGELNEKYMKQYGFSSPDVFTQWLKKNPSMIYRRDVTADEAKEMGLATGKTASAVVIPLSSLDTFLQRNGLTTKSTGTAPTSQQEKDPEQVKISQQGANSQVKATEKAAEEQTKAVKEGATKQTNAIQEAINKTQTKGLQTFQQNQNKQADAAANMLRSQAAANTKAAEDISKATSTVALPAGTKPMALPAGQPSSNLPMVLPPSSKELSDAFTKKYGMTPEEYDARTATPAYSADQLKNMQASIPKIVQTSKEASEQRARSMRILKETQPALDSVRTELATLRNAMVYTDKGFKEAQRFAGKGGWAETKFSSLGLKSADDKFLRDMQRLERVSKQVVQARNLDFTKAGYIRSPTTKYAEEYNALRKEYRRTGVLDKGWGAKDINKFASSQNLIAKENAELIKRYQVEKQLVEADIKRRNTIATLEKKEMELSAVVQTESKNLNSLNATIDITIQTLRKFNAALQNPQNQKVMANSNDPLARQQHELENKALYSRAIVEDRGRIAAAANKEIADAKTAANKEAAEAKAIATKEAADAKAIANQRAADNKAGLVRVYGPSAKQYLDEQEAENQRRINAMNKSARAFVAYDSPAGPRVPVVPTDKAYEVTKSVENLRKSTDENNKVTTQSNSGLENNIKNIGRLARNANRWLDKQQPEKSPYQDSYKNQLKNIEKTNAERAKYEAKYGYLRRGAGVYGEPDALSQYRYGTPGSRGVQQLPGDKMPSGRYAPTEQFTRTSFFSVLRRAWNKDSEKTTRYYGDAMTAEFSKSIDKSIQGTGFGSSLRRSLSQHILSPISKTKFGENFAYQMAQRLNPEKAARMRGNQILTASQNIQNIPAQYQPGMPISPRVFGSFMGTGSGIKADTTGFKKWATQGGMLRFLNIQDLQASWSKAATQWAAGGRKAALGTALGGVLGSVSMLFGPVEAAMLAFSVAQMAYNKGLENYNKKLTELQSALSESIDKYEKVEEAYSKSYKKNKDDIVKSQENISSVWKKQNSKRDIGTTTDVSAKTPKGTQFVGGSRKVENALITIAQARESGTLAQLDENTMKMHEALLKIRADVNRLAEQQADPLYGPFGEFTKIGSEFSAMIDSAGWNDDMIQFDSALSDYKDGARLLGSTYHGAITDEIAGGNLGLVENYLEGRRSAFFNDGAWSDKTVDKLQKTLADNIPEARSTDIYKDFARDIGQTSVKDMNKMMIALNKNEKDFKYLGKLLLHENANSGRIKNYITGLGLKTGLTSIQVRQAAIIQAVSDIRNIAENSILPQMKDTALAGYQTAVAARYGNDVNIGSLQAESAIYSAASAIATNVAVLTDNALTEQVEKDTQGHRGFLNLLSQQEAVEVASGGGHFWQKIVGIGLDKEKVLSAQHDKMIGLAMAANPTWSEHDAEIWIQNRQKEMLSKGITRSDVQYNAIEDTLLQGISGRSFREILKQYENSDTGSDDSGSGGKGSGSDKDSDKDKSSRKNWVNLAICNKKEIPKLNVNLFKKPPNFTILNRNFKLRDVNVNTADDAKSIQNAVKNSIIEIQNRSNPKIIQDDAAEYDPVNATEGNPIPTGTKKTE